MTKMEKIKKFSKYAVNALNMINALLLGLAQIWGWSIDKITASVIVVAGVISLYLVGGKLFDLREKEEDLGDIGHEIQDPEEFLTNLEPVVDTEPAEAEEQPAEVLVENRSE